MKYNSYSHFYLYAKGHYKCGDLIMDLKAILSNRCGVPAKWLSNHDLGQVLLPLAFKHIKNHTQFADFISYLNPESLLNRFAGDDKYEFNKRFFQSCISALRWVKTEEIDGELMPLDSNILEIAKNENA